MSKNTRIPIEQLEKILAKLNKEPRENMPVLTLKVIVSQHIYEAALIFEQLEHAGLIYGNGHHIAQDIASYAVKLFEKRLTYSHD